jgi:hypothetical protein
MTASAYVQNATIATLQHQPDDCEYQRHGRKNCGPAKHRTYVKQLVVVHRSNGP